MRRSVPGQASAGDCAEARLEPGLLRILEQPLGTGFHAGYNLPAGLASTAALAILAPASRDGVYWTGSELNLEWQGAAESDDAFIASARLTEISESMATFTIEGRTARRRPLYRGELRMIAMRGGRPVGIRSDAEHDAIRARIAERTQRELRKEDARLLAAMAAPGVIELGKSASCEVEIVNGDDNAAEVTVTATPPFGAGVSFDSDASITVTLGPKEKRRVSFKIRADRPHEVNLGQPWPLEFTAQSAGCCESACVRIAVPDPEPGRSFYLLTEDCETFDGGPLTGDYKRLGELGNQNNFMDPQDYRVQMIQKPERMNEIAERHGACWTHFYAATQRFAVDWASRQSSTGEWPKIAQEMDESVRRGSWLHEYCPHIHFDYEPDSPLPPQPRLVYDPATDGILPNNYYHPETNPTHWYHDWDGAARGISYIKDLGDWTGGSTKTGSLRKSIRHLARLQANKRQPLIGRTGTYDFGKPAEDQAVSTQAYLANGLRGNSDAYRHAWPPSRSGQLFWCEETDRQKEIANLSQARLVQFGITMDTMFQSAEEMNRWFAEHWPSCQGPGVHALLFTTHAMFIRGEPDSFRSLSGGGFDELDEHLDWVREHYPDVEFATASNAVCEYLDYYTPTLQAHTEARRSGGDPAKGRYEFPVRLLGRGIRVSAERPVTVRVAAPPCFSPEEILMMRVWQGDKVFASKENFDPRYRPELEVALTDRNTPLLLEVQLRAEPTAEALTWFGDKEFYDWPEAQERDLLRLRSPVVEGSQVRIWPDLVRALMNPVAGHSEPLGRRVHPLGGFTLGAALTAALAVAPPNSRPVRIQLRWLREVDLHSVYRADSHLAGQAIAVRIVDGAGALVAMADVEVETPDMQADLNA